MRLINLSILFFLITLSSVKGEMKYQTTVFSSQLKTLQVRIAGQLLTTPVIELNGSAQIEINFDLLGDGPERLAYNIIHCNADWSRSSLIPLEYMRGFQGLIIHDYAISMVTTTQYTNYNLRLPNNDVQLNKSGNYVVVVYNEDEPNNTLATACFSVLEPMVSIAAKVSSSTTIDFNKENQQVSFSLLTKSFPILYPQTDLKIYVLQNNRRDNMATNIKPMSIMNNEIRYENDRNLIFKAGNEYRRFEFLSSKYNGMGVNSMQFNNPYYNVELYTDQLRSNKSYQYDQDQNGRFLIRCSACNEPNTEGDYFIIHFALDSSPFMDGSVYLNGDLVTNLLDEKSKMEYSFESKQYKKSILLKTGNYNYQYLFVPKGDTLGETSTIEGNYYQTENEYTIAVYYRPTGERYDRLIGINTVKNGK